MVSPRFPAHERLGHGYLVTSRTAGTVGALVVAFAIAIGAFGTHTLEGRLTPQRLGTLDTAVTYQFYGGLGLLVMAAVGWSGAAPLTRAAGWAAAVLTAGIALFCGALYGLVAGGPGILGLVAPIGGAAMIGAWVYLAYGIWRGGVRRAR